MQSVCPSVKGVIFFTRKEFVGLFPVKVLYGINSGCTPSAISSFFDLSIHQRFRLCEKIRKQFHDDGLR